MQLFGCQGSRSTHRWSRLWDTILICSPTITQRWLPMRCCVLPHLAGLNHLRGIAPSADMHKPRQQGIGTQWAGLDGPTRNVLEGGGGGFGWDPPPPRVPLRSPPKAGQKLCSLNPLRTEGAEAKFWLSASNVGRGGRGGGGGSRGGIPPPPTVYSRSNTSLGPTVRPPCKLPAAHRRATLLAGREEHRRPARSGQSIHPNPPSSGSARRTSQPPHRLPTYCLAWAWGEGGSSSQGSVDRPISQNPYK